MDGGPPLVVDLIGEPATAMTGIGRYVDQLQGALTTIGVDARLTPFRFMPGANRRSILKTLPIGIQDRRTGSIVHIPQSMGASVLLSRRLYPCVVTVHDLGALYCAEDQAQMTRTGRALYHLSLRGLRRADHIIAVSEFTRGHVIQAGFDPDRVSVVHEGVDLARFFPRQDASGEIAARYGIDPGPGIPIVLYVGNELPRKNLRTLVLALGELKRQGVPFHWVKAGRAGYEPGRIELTRLIVEQQFADQVTIVDSVSDNDLPFLYSAATLYVQPSVWEGFGLPVLEAMACGTPVVASNAAALPETCVGAARLVNARDTTSLADSIAAVLLDPVERADLQRRGLEHIQSWSWERAGSATRTLYQGLSQRVSEKG